jgi:Ca2+-transporting ATPase
MTVQTDSKQMNWAMLGNSSWPCSSPRWMPSTGCSERSRSTCVNGAWALVPALALLVLWEFGKLIARRSAAARSNGNPPAIETTR